MISFVSVRFTNSTDDRAKSSESVAKAFGKSENLASETAEQSEHPSIV